MSDLSAKVREALDAAVTAIGGAPREGQIEARPLQTLTDRHHDSSPAQVLESSAYLIPPPSMVIKFWLTATLALNAN